MTTAKLLYISASTLFYLSIPRLPRFTLFPYTTLFRSREAFGKVDALLERFLDFLVVQRVRRAVDQAAPIGDGRAAPRRSEEHTSELQSRFDLVCRLLLEKIQYITLTW